MSQEAVAFYADERPAKGGSRKLAEGANADRAKVGEIFNLARYAHELQRANINRDDESVKSEIGNLAYVGGAPSFREPPLVGTTWPCVTASHFRAASFCEAFPSSLLGGLAD